MSMMITGAGSLLYTTTQYNDMLCCDMTCYVIQNTKVQIQYIVLAVSQLASARPAADVTHITHHSVNDMLKYYMLVIQQCARTDLSV